MSDVLQSTDALDFREMGHVLASLSGVDLTKASKASVRAREARGRALIELSRGAGPKPGGSCPPPVSKRRRRGANLAAAGAPKEEA